MFKDGSKTVLVEDFSKGCSIDLRQFGFEQHRNLALHRCLETRSDALDSSIPALLVHISNTYQY